MFSKKNIKNTKMKNTRTTRKNTKKNIKTNTRNTNNTKKNIKNNTRRSTRVESYKKQYDKLVKLRCSPSSKKKEYSCLSDPAIYKLRDLWNARHPDSKIETNDVKVIWEKMKENMKSVCNKESCWLKQNFVQGKMNDELKNAFAPESPPEWKKNPNEWLSSIDIINVMKQYEKEYKCFDFIGPSPIDFDTHKMYGDCVWEELCHFDLKTEIKNGRFKIGIIFNLDPHTKDGSHWVSLFINVKKKSIFYFDSAGEKIPPLIMNFVDRVMEQGRNLKTPVRFHFDQNYPVEHQYGDTECGIYSIFFIAHMVEDKITQHYLKTHILKDKYMEQFRKIYFNPEL